MPAQSAGFLLWQASLRWQREVADALTPYELTHSQFVLLSAAWWLNEGWAEKPNQRRLADYTGLDPMMTSQVLRALEARGLVERKPNPTDSRARVIDVTAMGSALAQQAIALVEVVDRKFFSAGDQEHLLSTLGALSRFPLGRGAAAKRTPKPKRPEPSSRQQALRLWP
jgi:DNA-binding MarR family transcriptional regulator